MESWGQLVDFVKENYHVAEQNDQRLILHFPVGDDRTQVVFVWHSSTRDGEEWILIESPIGELDKINLRALLELVEERVVGGAAAFKGHVVLRDAVLLADMSAEQFERPLLSITGAADDLERELTGADRY